MKVDGFELSFLRAVYKVSCGVVSDYLNMLNPNLKMAFDVCMIMYSVYIRYSDSWVFV